MSNQAVAMSDGIQLKNIKHTGEDDPPPEYNKTTIGLANPIFTNSHDTLPEKGENGETAVDLQDIEIEEEDEDYIQPPDGLPLKIHKVRQALETAFGDHWNIIKWCILAACLLGYFVYFGLAIKYGVKHDVLGTEPWTRLLWITCLVVACIILYVVWKYGGKHIKKCLEPGLHCCEARGRIVMWVVLLLIYIGVLTFIFVDVFTADPIQTYNLVSLAGLVCYVLFCFVFSYSPAHVNWRAVLWGIAIQFVLALIILRWDKGYQAFDWIGTQVSTFLDHSDYGAIFMFGSSYMDHFFAFKVLPVIVFFSTAISMLYYLGVMQVIVQKVGWVLQTLLGTTAGESLNAAGNIFIGQSEAPLMIRPLIPDMTRSELHSIMTGGFATIAGSVLAAYLAFGVPANHLISASVMSAPAALAMSKLFYPETQVSKTRAEDVAHMEPSKERNIIEAASNGASQSIKLVANIAVNLIAFLAMLHFFNSFLCWMGQRVGWTDPCLSFELICSYLFFPLAVFMGVDLVDCRIVAELIGVKTFLNEFVAYSSLGVMIKNKEYLLSHVGMNGTYEAIKDDIVVYNFTHPEDNTYHNMFSLERGILQDRSEVISTYALCGFANFGSMGIMLGALGAMAPQRKPDLARVVLRAMIAGNVACFMTACIAGVFYQKNLTLDEQSVFDYLNGVTM